MQILHHWEGSIEKYLEQLKDADRYRPQSCRQPSCQSNQPLAAHGFYTRTLSDTNFEDTIAVRRYLCKRCRRTVSLLVQCALPLVRHSVTVIGAFLVNRLLDNKTLQASLPRGAPYQRGQFWLRRFAAQAEDLCASLAARTAPPRAEDFSQRAARMLQTVGWIKGHRFLFGMVRAHLLGWPKWLAPAGLPAGLVPAAAPADG